MIESMIFYPKGIGKHIVCIYADRKRPPHYKQFIGANPEPQFNLPWYIPQNERY